jgi:hypothetical protein
MKLAQAVGRPLTQAKGEMIAVLRKGHGDKLDASASKCDGCVTKKSVLVAYYLFGVAVRARTPPRSHFLDHAIWNDKYCAIFANAHICRGEHAHICREKKEST